MDNTKIKNEELNQELVFKPRKVLKKRVIFVETDDELIDLYEKLDMVNAKMVYFVIPQKALIFQSLINLKILKKKATEKGKKIYFITNDSNGINLAKQLKIRVYDKVNKDNSPSLFSSKSDEDFLNISPLKASVNAIIEHTPTRLSEKKISISELLNRGKNLAKSTKDSPKIDSKLSVKKKEKNPLKLKISTPNKGPLLAFLSLSSVIIFAIFYIALPSATIILTPSASVLEKSVNITLVDFNKNKSELESFPINTIASFPVSKEIVREITYTATGKKISERGGNAKGNITIINNSSSNWPLIARTRFQNIDGIVFRIKDGVNVPANGRIKAFVEADAVDAYGQVVGDRGNIGPTRFFLPGLSEENRANVYAESEENMIGGITDFVTYVSDADLDGARAKLEAVLKKDIAEEIQLEVREKNKEASKSIEYVLLKEDNALQISKADFQIASNIAGTELLEFSISGKISGNGIYYDRTAMLNILKAELITQKSPQKELLRINEDSTSLSIFPRDDIAGKIRMTAKIKGIEQYDISPESQNGRRILEKIRNHIAGRDKEYSINYIQNLSEVNKVEINSWPFWAPTIPKLEENIKFELRQAVIVN